MFGRRASSDASAEGKAPKPRREGRGLGPFTSGHLTIIVVTVVIIVAFPFAAYAVTGSNVFVTDATSGNRAAVAGGKLKVDTGLSAFGVVPVAPVAPTIYPTNDIIHTDNGLGADYVVVNDCSSGLCQTLFKPPAGKAAVVTSIHIDTYQVSGPGGGVFVDIVRSSDGTCNASSLDRDIEVINPAGIGETVLPYDLPGGLPVAAGRALCVSKGGNVFSQASAWGYAVASNAVPSSAAAANAPQGAALLKPQQSR